ncbi:MAG: hypothetical protein WDN75_19865 [Bacteroidota bacterium]
MIGVIIGEFLEKSGGAFAMAEKILKVIGKNRVPTAMGLIGWIVANSCICRQWFHNIKPF